MLRDWPSFVPRLLLTNAACVRALRELVFRFPEARVKKSASHYWRERNPLLSDLAFARKLKIDGRLTGVMKQAACRGLAKGSLPDERL